jgi:hypothetical protein
MNESSCYDPKMSAYYQEVRKLEDKFDGLKLSHIARWLNEVANELAKMASDRDPILAGVFASDQHKPLVHFEKPGQACDEPPASGSRLGTNLPIALPDPEVMEINEDAEVEPDPPAD